MTSTILMHCSTTSHSPSVSTSDDPFRWLEDVEGKASLDWARKHNEATLRELQSDPRYKTVEKEVRAILTAKDRIPMPGMIQGEVYNFWQDEKNVKGLWRRAPLESYVTAKPRWETLLDVDQLSRKEKESWVVKGFNCLRPENQRCLLALSRGGKDAVVIREYNPDRKTFLTNGFQLPEAKTHISWVDAGTVLVATDFGPGSLTQTGYPRILKRWKRGQPLEQATTVFEVSPEELSVEGFTTFMPEGNQTFVRRAIRFFEEELYRVDPLTWKLKKVPLPVDAEMMTVFRERIFAKLRTPWRISGREFPAGALVAIPIEADEKSPFAVEEVFTPAPGLSLTGVSRTSNTMFIDVLDHVQGKIFQVARKRDGTWSSKQLKIGSDGRDLGVASVADSDAYDTRFFVDYEGFLTPTTLSLVDGPGIRKIKRLPPRFDASRIETEQWEATSADGAKIPFFIVHRKGLKLDGSQPTLLYGYGGFEIPEIPFYLNALGKTWTERDGVFVLANIRGGGEFGPNWHRAAILKNKQRSYDDFIAVAEELIRRKITSPAHLGIMGGSNGGLLVGAVTVQRPDLFGAVVCQVPLLDMLRYHKLLAGHSWMAEYGDPDDPAMREIIVKYSPYQNVKAGVHYPRMFINTSTRDDRVHPGHARKMVAKLESLGDPVLYFENIEGGHGGAADLEQRILIKSLEYVYLMRQLGVSK